MDAISKQIELINSLLEIKTSSDFHLDFPCIILVAVLIILHKQRRNKYVAEFLILMIIFDSIYQAPTFLQNLVMVDPIVVAAIL
jgi:general stress protein CsbA